MNITCDTTEDQIKFLEQYYWWLETCGYLTIGVLGLIVNTVVILILLTPTMWTNLFQPIIDLLNII